MLNESKKRKKILGMSSGAKIFERF